MKCTPTSLPGVIVIEPDVFRDERGFFFENYNQKKYGTNGFPERFVQDNHSRSTQGTLRGLHAQLAHPQGKLVRVLVGEIWDVAVDIRSGSPTFRKWFGLSLSADNFKQLYIPPGFAHGFCVTSPIAEVEYKVTDFWDPADEVHLAWNDPEIAIAWPIQDPFLSPKDRSGVRLADVSSLLPSYDSSSRSK